jgi:hypothetical protein
MCGAAPSRQQRQGGRGGVSRVTLGAMRDDLNGESCTIVLFEEPGGEIESLALIDGTLDVCGPRVGLLPAGGDPTPIPPHLVDAIEPVSEELRDVLEDLTGTLCLRAFYPRRLPEPLDLTAVLEACAGPPMER